MKTSSIATKAERMDGLPQPEWNDPASVATALTALEAAHDDTSANEAYDRFLWAVGNNHSGTYYPVVLAALPRLEKIFVEGGVWAQQAAIESLIDLGGSFVPEPGHEEHLGTSVGAALRAFIRVLRPRFVQLAEAGDVRSQGARDLVELIDDLSD